MSDYGVRINRALNYAQEKLPACVELGLKGTDLFSAINITTAFVFAY